MAYNLRIREQSNAQLNPHTAAVPKGAWSMALLTSFESFIDHEWVQPLVLRYVKDAKLAHAARKQITQDLFDINEDFIRREKRTVFTSVESRVKEDSSFMRKLYENCKSHSLTNGLTQETLDHLYSEIHDLCGIRFSCPYFDEIIPTINDIVRPKLAENTYAIDLRSESGLHDRDYLEDADEFGYRSYHFYIKVPTNIDVYNNKKMVLCEVQARSELQHIWAVKSHELLYKAEFDLNSLDPDVLNDMRQLSHSLRALDQFLISLRNRVKKGVKS